MSIALASGALLMWPVIQGAGGGLTAEGAVQLINREKAVVIDVCETEEFAAGHMGGAKNIPLGQLEEKLVPPSKTRPCPLFWCARRVRARGVQSLSPRSSVLRMRKIWWAA